MSRFGAMRVTAVVVSVPLLSTSLPAFAQPTYTEIQLLVNIQKGVDVGAPGPEDDKAWVKEMVDRANEILMQAGARLKFDPDTDIKTNFNDQGNNNDKIEPGEDTNLDDHAKNELKKHTGKEGQGYKIVITNEIHSIATARGLSPHNPDKPVSYIQNAGSVRDRGHTLAHEFCHVFTLGANHLVDDHDDADPNNDDRADGAAHVSDPNNLMHDDPDPNAIDPNATNLTEDQKSEVRKGVKDHGELIKERARKRIRFWRCGGCGTGGMRDKFGGPLLPPRFYDLLDVTMSQSEVSDPFLAHVTFTGGLGSGDQLRLLIALDTDDNPSTGATVSRPFGPAAQGVDRLVRIDSAGDPQAGGAVTGVLLDPNLSELLQLNVEFEHLVKITDVLPPGSSFATVVYDQISVSLDPLLLSIQASMVPVEIIALDVLDPDEGFDDGSFILDLIDPVEPRIELSAYAARGGQTVRTSGFDFFPNATGIVQMGGTTVAYFSTDGAGDFPASAVEFPVPLGTTPGTYFITASAAMPGVGEPTQFSFQVLDVVSGQGNGGGGPTRSIPTLSEWALFILIGLMGLTGAWLITRGGRS